MGAAILNFITRYTYIHTYINYSSLKKGCSAIIIRYGCRYCYSLEVLLCETIEQPLHVMKFKMAAPGKFKNENGR